MADGEQHMRAFGYTLTVAFLSFTLEPASAQVSLSIGTMAADPGQTIAIPISIAVPNTQISGVQWTVSYAPQDFIFVSAGTGTAAALAGKTVHCRVVATGRLTCIAFGLNSKTLANGAMASLSFKAGTAGGITSVVTSSAGVAATIAGAPLAIASASATLSIRANPAVLQTLSCSTRTLTLAAPSLACTLTLSNPAPAGGFAISLGTTITGITVLNLAKSVIVPARAKTVTFPVTAASAIGTAGAVLSATANAVSRSWTFSIAGAVVTVGLAPRAVTLYPGQKAQFQASVSGIQNTAVVWSLAPKTGLISTSGLYTAPSQISAVSQVTLTAASVADPSKKITAILTLAPAVTISAAPTAYTLASGQSLTFLATVGGGAQNKAVAWSLIPNLGTISSAGLYKAPAQVTSQTKVTLTATSLADATKKTAAVVTLIPQIMIAVAPGAAAVSRSRTQQFTASLSGTANTAVTWSVLPAGAGTVSTSGLYTAPAAIPTAPTVMVLATSVADKTRQARALIAVK